MSRRRGRVSIALGAVLMLAGITIVLVFALHRPTGHQAAAGSSAPTAAQRPGPVDIGFSQDMTAHHTQAILMADDVVTHADPEIRALALSILTEQSQESGTMKGWLAVWAAPQLPSGPPMTWMKSPRTRHGDAMTMQTQMPGMATQSELDELTTGHGRALDVSFLQLMIRHHQGGILMASYAATHARTALVRSTAAEMVLEQTTENEFMLGLLHRLGGRPLSLS